MKTSEWVSLGHSDKTADFVSEYILDRIFEMDSHVRYALEVQLKGNHAMLSGEISTSADLLAVLFQKWTREAIAKVGYNADYARKWGEDNVPNASKFDCSLHISTQSPDIAAGVDGEGWGDQGIFFGMAVRDASTHWMPKDIFLAREIGRELYESEHCGLDIKTQVTIDDNGKPEEVIVAAPVLSDADLERVKMTAKFICMKHTGENPHSLIVNGTGKFVRHSTMGDCGVAGRKLAVDFYGGNCEIGGGSPWTKDCTKADLTLNAYARKLAFDYLMAKSSLNVVKCRISCCIGYHEIFIQFMDGENHVLDTYKEEATPRWLAESLGLLKPCLADICREGIPYAIV